MRRMIVVMSALMASAVVVWAGAAAPQGKPKADAAPSKPKVNHVPERADGLRAFSVQASELRHIELVNVANAVPAADWDIITRYVAKTMPMNYWTNSLAKSITFDLITGKIRAHEDVLGKKATIAVFVEKDGTGRPSFLSSACRWSSVDLSKAVSSAPDAQTARDRTAKYIMRAIAYAIGGGAAMDRNSTLSSRVVTLQQLDETAIVCPPMSLFPLVEAVDMLTGGEGGTRPMEEDGEPDAEK